jgi:hypothetical protein
VPLLPATLSCQESGTCESPTGDGPGLALSGITPARCTDELTLDDDSDGFEDHCEYQIAWAFRPRLSFHPAEAHHSRESYWSALYAKPDGVPTVSVMYLLAYHDDAGSAGVGAHRGDSEFVIVDVVWAETWKLERVFMTAHWRSLDGVGDRSDTYNWWDLHYTGPVRGRPTVVVSLSKHANYNSATRCNWSLETGCALPGMYRDADVLPQRNIGSSTIPLVDCVPSVTPDVHPGTECFWTDAYFDGWHAGSDATPGYRRGLSFFEARLGFRPDSDIDTLAIHGIAGPQLITTAGTFAWEAFAAGGTGNYVYEWTCAWDGVPEHCGSDKMLIAHIDPSEKPGQHALTLSVTVSSMEKAVSRQLAVTVSSALAPNFAGHAADRR